MKDILQYLQQNIDTKATIKDWDAKQFLNLQLATTYDYSMVTVLDEEFLLIRPIETQTIQKTMMHIARIQEKVDYDVAILLEDATRYRVKKMMEERVAFLTVDRQMYLPFLALHIKKRQGERKEIEPRKKFTAATQLVFLKVLYTKQEQFGVDELAKELNLSAMTVLRALDELQRLGLVHCEIGGQTGRKKVFETIDKKEYYRLGVVYLTNPVKKNIYVREIPKDIKIYKGGLTALGEQTMLGEPDRKVYAFSGKIEEVEIYQVDKEQALEEMLPGIQIMKYDIGLITKNEYVDPVTLLLSLDTVDDRIEIAIDELMEGFDWYEG